MRKFIFIYILLVLTSFMAFSPASSGGGKKKTIDGTIHLSVGSVAAGIGWTWGEGVLTLQGVDHNFEIKGLSVADVGISKLSASGIVYNLKNLEDFNGIYHGLKAGAAVGGGAGAVVLKNNHGVELQLNSSGQGLKFAFGTQGVTIQLKD
ncbi:MAG: hypothetical protein CG439_2072 [Methylococcaceae bacterium NSP1-2]|nr:hypothetical protein [Methylococcaceae bacterium]OYV16540.1 MAG: hypothetical protein CG439_2072 [Methylococcaceae bacterium NSP1-2]